jgi:hypothetical protein
MLSLERNGPELEKFAKRGLPFAPMHESNRSRAAAIWRATSVALALTLSACAAQNRGETTPIETPTTVRYSLHRDALYSGTLHATRDRSAPDGSVIHDELRCQVHAKVLGQERNGKIWLEFQTSDVLIAWTPSVESRMGSTEFATEIAGLFQDMRVRVGIDEHGEILDLPRTPNQFTNDQADVLAVLVRTLIGTIVRLPQAALDDKPSVDRRDVRGSSDGATISVVRDTRVRGRTADGAIRLVQNMDQRTRTLSRSDGHDQRLRVELEGDFLPSSGWWRKVSGTELDISEKDSIVRYEVAWKQTKSGRADAPRFEIQNQVLAPCHLEYVGPLTCTHETKVDEEGRKEKVVDDGGATPSPDEANAPSSEAEPEGAPPAASPTESTTAPKLD